MKIDGGLTGLTTPADKGGIGAIGEAARRLGVSRRRAYRLALE